jgi:hypothetical protein
MTTWGGDPVAWGGVWASWGPPPVVVSPIVARGRGRGSVRPAAMPVASLLPITARGRGTGTVHREPKTTGRRLIVTDVWGAVKAELAEVDFGDLTFEENKWESWSFTLPADNPKIAPLLNEKVLEVQYWSGDSLLAWGPLVRPQASLAGFRGECRGVMWYLSRRFVGPPRRRNYVVNGSFEEGVKGWGLFTSKVAIHYGFPYAQATPPLHQIVSDPVLTGQRALRLENYVAGADAYAGQTFLFTVDDPEGDDWYLKGFVFVESFDEPAVQKRGLYLERTSTTEPETNPDVLAVLPNAKKSIETGIIQIDENTPQGEWLRFEIPLTQPFKAGEPETIGVRIYPPKGVVYWDGIGLFRDEALKFRRTPQRDIAEALVDHAQDTSIEKSDVNLTVDPGPGGARRDRTYPFVERANIFEAVSEFTDLDNGFDLHTRYTPTSRHVVCRRQGRVVRAAALQTGRNVSSFQWTFDGEQAATAAVTLGQGSSPAREEGWALDVSGYSGGLTLETVEIAPPETPIDSLDNMAGELLAMARVPEVLEVQTHPHQSRLAALVRPGDSVPVLIRLWQGDRLVFEVDDIYRVARMTLSGVAEAVSFTLNRRPE